MANSISSYNLSYQVRQIQENINASHTLNTFLDKKYLSIFFNQTNSDHQNILEILAAILILLVGSQEKLKQILVDLLVNNLSTLETQIKNHLKQYTFQLLSCNLDAKLNVPLGVVDESVSTTPECYPYIDQYDFYGLFTKNIDDPLQKLQFDRNLNSFIKNQINSHATTFTWVNSNNVKVVKFTYDESQERIKVGPPTGADWGPNGISIKEFVDLYIDSINLFPTESVLKELLDTIFNMKEGDPFKMDLDFLTNLLFKKYKCKNNIEDDKSKSTFELDYNDFISDTINENDSSQFVTTNIKFGPVDAPIPPTIIPQQPDLNNDYLNTVALLSTDDFIKSNRNKKESQIYNALDKVGQSYNNQSNKINSSLNTKFSFKPNLEANMNLKMILMLPMVLVQPLFSPKITMYFGVIYKRYYINDNPARDLWKNKKEYYAFISKLIDIIVSDLIKYLTKKLFAIIKKEIIKLIKKIIARILADKINGYIAQIQSLIEIYKALRGVIPPQLPMINFNSCKSILVNLLKLFEIPNIPPGLILPPGMSMMGLAKTGLSATSMTQKAVLYMNILGLNTQPMPDGTPNPNVVIANAISLAMVDEMKNARIQVSTVGIGLSEGGGTIT